MRPSRRICNFCSCVKPQSVKSGAAAIPIRADSRSGRARATSSASQPPMEEPIRTNGPSTRLSIRKRTSSRHCVSVPSSNRPSLTQWRDDVLFLIDSLVEGPTVDQKKNIITPLCQRALLQQAFAHAASRIIEPQHRASVRLRPDIECGRLAPFHIGHISRQKNQSGSMPRTVTISEAKPVRAGEIEWFSHDRALWQVLAITSNRLTRAPSPYKACVFHHKIDCSLLS